MNTVVNIIKTLYNYSGLYNIQFPSPLIFDCKGDWQGLLLYDYQFAMMVYYIVSFEWWKHQLVKLQYMLVVLNRLFPMCAWREFHFKNFVWLNMASVIVSPHRNPCQDLCMKNYIGNIHTWMVIVSWSRCDKLSRHVNTCVEYDIAWWHQMGHTLFIFIRWNVFGCLLFCSTFSTRLYLKCIIWCKLLS